MLISAAAMFQAAEVRLGRWSTTFAVAVSLVLLVAIVLLAQAGRNRAGLFQSRLAVWQQASESGRAPYTAATQLATVLIETRDYPQAEKFARKAIEANPTKAGGWSSLAAALGHQGKEVEALAELENAVKSAVDDGRLAFARGNLLAKTDSAAAIEQFERALELDGSNESAWNNLGILLAREPATYDRAQECYQRSLAVRFDNKSVFQNLAALHVKAGRLYDARSVYLNALSAIGNDRDIRARLSTVEALIREQEMRKAIKDK